MAASSQSLSIPPVIHTTPVARRPLAVALVQETIQRVVQRAIPLVTTSAGVALATLAAERTVASLALRAVERSGLQRVIAPVPSVDVDSGIVRVTVTSTTVVERITRRR